MRSTMKTDHSFKLVAALILAGVVIAFVSNVHAAAPKAVTGSHSVAVTTATR